MFPPRCLRARFPVVVRPASIFSVRVRRRRQIVIRPSACRAMEEEERNGGRSNRAANRLSAVLLLVLSMIVARSECRKYQKPKAMMVITDIQERGTKIMLQKPGFNL